MGDIDNKPDKDFKSQKPLDACAALAREVDATEMRSFSSVNAVSPESSMSSMRVSAVSMDGFLDFSTIGGTIGRFAGDVDNDDVGLALAGLLSET